MAIELPLTSPEEAARYRRLGYWRDVTLTDCFLAVAARYPDKTAIIEQTRTYTYAEARQLVDNLAGNFLDLGLKPGEVVALQSKNAAEMALIHFACNRIGLLYMPIHDTWRETELKHLLKTAKARMIVIPTVYRDFDYVTMIDAVRPETPDLQYVFSLEERAGCRAFSELLRPTRRTAENLDACRPDPDLPAHIMLSGGTTAVSKISRFSSNDLLMLLDATAKGSGFVPDDRGAAIAPAGTGATGYVYPILMPLLFGATSVILERWGEPEDAIQLILDHQCTYAVGIPTQLTRMVPCLEARRPEQFDHFRCFINAGAPLPYETGLKIETLMNCATHTIYGSTDGGCPTVTTLQDPQDKRLRTVGRVCAGVECELWDSDDKPVAQGQSGEVVWRCGQKSWGYLGDDVQTAAAFTADRFYKSGDLGRFDEDGYLQIVGRIKDMILRGGRNIFPRLIEELLMKHPAVLDVSVAAIPDPVLGERACAFVVPRSGKSLGFEEMIDFLKTQKIATWQLPERLEIMTDLPRGAGDKVTKAALTAMVAEKLKAEKTLPA